MEDMTFVVKTLERPYCLERLVRSVLKRYPEAEILIGDDSRRSSRKAMESRHRGSNVTVYELPHDCGISYGRNYLVRRVRTPFFVLLDDDFVLDDGSDIERGLEILRERDLDIVGGFFRNYPTLRPGLGVVPYLARRLLRGVRASNYMGRIALCDDELRVEYRTKDIPDFEMTDIVHNFFVARTEAVRDRCPWDDELKVHEHTPFFLKAKLAGLRVGFTSEMSVQHRPIRTKEYMRYRDRDYVGVWMQRYGVRRFVYTMDGGPEVVREI